MGGRTGCLDHRWFWYVSMNPLLESTQQMDEVQWWDFWNSSYRATEDPGAIARELFVRVAAVVNEITKKRACRILEVGCGAGVLCHLLRYSSYHGIDLSPAAIEIARKRAENTPRPRDDASLVFEAGDFHDWRGTGEAFDIVVCLDAFAWVRDQRAVMHNMARCLRPSGKLVLANVNPFVYQRIRRTPSQPLQVGPFSRWLTRSELRGFVQDAGLTIERFNTIMPRGDLGILRLVNSWRLNRACGPRFEALLRRLKERAGLGQYFVLVANRNR